MNGTCVAAAPDPRPDGSGESTFDSFIKCDSTLGASACPPTEAGAPMTCFQASTLAGHDFCADACDPNQPVADPSRYECVASGALLRRCHPNSSVTPAADCPSQLSCYRTNIAVDTGLCIAMPVCAKDTDCMNATYNTCASTVVSGIASSSPLVRLGLVRLDHLNCLQASCSALQTSCPSGEGCLGAEYFDLSDICVPNCAGQTCPPNYSCLQAVSGPGAPPLCLPGLPGTRCDGDHCVFGDCEDAGAGFSACTISCASDTDCKVLNTSVDQFFCVQGGGSKHCLTGRSFGPDCSTTNQCNAARAEICQHVNVYGMETSRGTCRVPCNADGTCDPQGGLAHACLAGTCTPGLVGVPCLRDAECAGSFSCQAVPTELADSGGGSHICTMSCATDGGTDQEGDSICGGAAGGYCAGGFCRVKREAGGWCTRPAQCLSGICNGPTQACVTAPAGTGG